MLTLVLSLIPVGRAAIEQLTADEDGRELLKEIDNFTGRSGTVTAEALAKNAQKIFQYIVDKRHVRYDWKARDFERSLIQLANSFGPEQHEVSVAEVTIQIEKDARGSCGCVLL
uniref:Uncharacterized protein n=1 Tax=Haptolina brevifila TaxID=156173 RepID=A0A7S2GBH4_9EUKA|mmetsp:Transcript_32981/g.65612  ORF Transcript_32981/g.65612 Transcript_32981/m.65612 type:complete len:114 (+) Transcript_32981:41-382(+)